eukprot:scaffold104600_cov34-Tisochrysis_lutea.AAC.3
MQVLRRSISLSKLQREISSCNERASLSIPGAEHNVVLKTIIAGRGSTGISGDAAARATGCIWATWDAQSVGLSMEEERSHRGPREHSQRGSGARERSFRSRIIPVGGHAGSTATDSNTRPPGRANNGGAGGAFDGLVLGSAVVSRRTQRRRRARKELPGSGCHTMLSTVRTERSDAVTLLCPLAPVEVTMLEHGETPFAACECLGAYCHPSESVGPTSKSILQPPAHAKPGGGDTAVSVPNSSPESS